MYIRNANYFYIINLNDNTVAVINYPLHDSGIMFA